MSLKDKLTETTKTHGPHNSRIQAFNAPSDLLSNHFTSTGTCMPMDIIFEAGGTGFIWYGRVAPPRRKTSRKSLNHSSPFSSNDFRRLWRHETPPMHCKPDEQRNVLSICMTCVHAGFFHHPVWCFGEGRSGRAYLSRASSRFFPRYPVNTLDGQDPRRYYCAKPFDIMCTFCW